MFAQYDTTGAQQWQTGGRLLGSCEMDLKPWNSGYVFTGLEDVQEVGNIFIQKLRANGDTLPARRIPVTAASGFPVQLLTDRRGFTVAAFNSVDRVPGQNSNQELEIIRTDTNGVVRWARTYPNPTPNTRPLVFAYGNGMVRTARGGYLYSGILTHPSFFYQPYLLETDSLGNPRRTRIPLQLTGNQQMITRRLWNDFVPAQDGSGYFITGDYRADASNTVPSYDQGMVVKLDTALNVVWQRLLPPQRTAGVRLTSVREQPDGTLLLLASDGILDATGINRPNAYLYVFTLSAGGQVLRVREARSQLPGVTQVLPYDWQAIAGDSAFYVSGLATQAGRTRAWVGKFVPVRRPLSSLRELPAPLWLGEPYPNPAAAGAADVVRLPYGWRAGTARGAAVELRLVSAVGQVLGRWPLPGPAPEGEWQVPVAGRAAGLYHLLLLVDGQTRAARRLVLE